MNNANSDIQGHERNQEANIFTSNVQNEDYICSDMKQSQSYTNEQILQITDRDRDYSIVNKDYQKEHGSEEQSMLKKDNELKFTNYITHRSNQQIWSAQISEDEKYLGIVQNDRKIQIYYLKNKKLMKIIKLDGFSDRQYHYSIIKFTSDSRYFLCADNFGYLFCFDITNQFKIIYKQKIHSKSINDILTIDNDLILTCSSDESLIITNIKLNQQIIQIKNAHDQSISGIEFDNQNDLIISCSRDYSKKFFDINDGTLQIQKQNAHAKEGYGIQLIQIQGRNNLISSNIHYLMLWYIDYKERQLIKIKELKYLIYNFSSVLDHKRLAVVCKQYVQILDNDLVQIFLINHRIKELHNFYQTRQLNSLNYVVLVGYYSIYQLKSLQNNSKFQKDQEKDTYDVEYLYLRILKTSKKKLFLQQLKKIKQQHYIIYQQ